MAEYAGNYQYRCYDRIVATKRHYAAAHQLRRYERLVCWRGAWLGVSGFALHQLYDSPRYYYYEATR